MTGDMVKDVDVADDVDFKPADRQIYAYNLTSGVAFENNGMNHRHHSSLF